MLEILALTTINEVLYGYQLELPDDISLNFIWENPLFVSDRVPAAYTLDFDVPPTPNNLLFFSYPNRITVVGAKSSCPVIIKHSGINIASGELKVINFDQKLTLQFVGSIDPLDVKLKLNNIDALPSYELGGTMPSASSPYYPISNFAYGLPDWLDYQNNAIQASTDNPPSEVPYCLAPVRKENVDWDGELYMRGGINSFKQYYNFFNAHDNSFLIYDLNTSDAPRIHAPIVPFPTINLIIEQTLGSILESNPFATGDMQKLVLVGCNHERYLFENFYRTWIRTLPSSYGVNAYKQVLVENLIPLSETTAAGDSVTWALKNFMQQYPFIDLLKNIMKIFGLSLFRGTNYKMEFDNDIFDRTVVVNFDHLMDGEPFIERLPPCDYFFAYNGKSSQFTGEVNGTGTWQTVYLAARANQVNVEFLYKILGTSQVVGLTKSLRGIVAPDEGNSSGQVWIQSRIVNTGLATDQTKTYEDEEAVVITSDIAPLEMNIEKYWWQNNSWGTIYGSPGELLFKRHWVVPVMPEPKPEDPPHIMIFAGRQNTLYRNLSLQYPDQYPLLTNSDKDNAGNTINSFSLLPDGTTGITNTFHARKKAWYHKERIQLKAYFMLEAQDLKTLDMRDKYYIRGAHFYIKQIEFSLTHRQISKSYITMIQC